VSTRAHGNNFFMYRGYQSIMSYRDKEDNQEKKIGKIGRIIVVGLGVVILFLFLSTNDYFLDDCIVSERKLIRTAEVEGEFTERFEEAYKEHFTECQYYYSLEEQITFNRKLNEVINEQRAIEDV